MTTYTAVAERSEGWWAVHVPEVAGARTQARRLEQIEPMAREVIALLLDTDEDSFALEVDVRLPPGSTPRCPGCVRHARPPQTPNARR